MSDAESFKFVNRMAVAGFPIIAGLGYYVLGSFIEKNMAPAHPGYIDPEFGDVLADTGLVAAEYGCYAALLVVIWHYAFSPRVQK